MITALMRELNQILTRGLIPGNERYLPRQMYIEYANVAAPGDTVTLPTIDVDETVDYYAALDGDPLADYLRIPLGFMTPEASDELVAPNGDTNVFVGNPADGGLTVGVHGKPFSSGSNSKIYGGAIVAIPNPTDRSQDLQLMRFYLEGAEQFLFSSGSQKLVIVRWPILIPD